MVDEQRLADGGGADRASGNPAPPAPVVAIEEARARTEVEEAYRSVLRAVTQVRGWERAKAKGGMVPATPPDAMKEVRFLMAAMKREEAEALRAATARAERAEDALLEYGEHDDECEFLVTDDGGTACSCGMVEVWFAIFDSPERCAALSATEEDAGPSASRTS